MGENERSIADVESTAVDEPGAYDESISDDEFGAASGFEPEFGDFGAIAGHEPASSEVEPGSVSVSDSDDEP